MTDLVGFSIYIFLLSCAVERLLEFIKLAFPPRQWKSQRKWKLMLGLLGSAIGTMLAYFCYLPNPFYTQDSVAFAFMIGTTVCAGSHPWHDLLLLAMNKKD